MNETPIRLRGVEAQVDGVQTQDGAGVRLTRVLGASLQRRLDPFLMLDAFASDDPDDYIAGFPDHPHRGFETITYMVEGRMLHRDSAGHEGLLEAGGMQWMTAGRGVVHSEIPQQESGRMEGFQLWLNLPADAKMCAPWYRDFSAAELPRLRTAHGVDAVVLAGRCGDVAGAITRDATAPLIVDLHLDAGGRFEQPLPGAHNALLYVYRGEVEIGGQRVAQRTMAVFDNDGDALRIDAPQGARALLVAGRPLREPIAQYGPFVMNTEQQIYQAVNDFRAGRLGG